MGRNIVAGRQTDNAPGDVFGHRVKRRIVAENGQIGAARVDWRVVPVRYRDAAGLEHLIEVVAQLGGPADQRVADESLGAGGRQPEVGLVGERLGVDVADAGSVGQVLIERRQGVFDDQSVDPCEPSGRADGASALKLDWRHRLAQDAGARQQAAEP